MHTFTYTYTYKYTYTRHTWVCMLLEGDGLPTRGYG